MHRIHSAILIALAVYLVADAAAGGDAPRAEASFWAGSSLFRRREYDAAAREFARAYQENPLEKYLWNLALSEFRAGRYWSAYKHFEQYKSDSLATSDNLAHVDEILANAERHLGHLTVEAPVGATVSLDGQTQSTAPLSGPIVIDPDQEHDVSADRGLYHQTIHLAAGGENSLSVRFEEPPPPVLLDASAFVPSTPLPLPNMPLPHSGSTAARNVATIAVLGLAAASAGIGVGYFLATRNDSEVAQAIYPRLDVEARVTGTPRDAVCRVHPALTDCLALADITQRWRDNVTLQDGFYIAAGGLAVVGAVTFFVWPKPRSETTGWVRPILGKGAASILVGGMF